MMLLSLLAVGFIAGTCSGQSETAQLVRLTDAVNDTGAVCLDGSPPAYYFRPGSSDGENKWIVHLMGGGWCFSLEDCAERAGSLLGSTSSVFWPDSAPFDGFLSNLESVNPYFYNWNLVFAIYCDGGSFAGNVDEPLNVGGSMIYLRGRRNLDAIIESVLDSGMKNATDVIFTGCSAGATATFVLTDYVGSLMPSGVKYRAFTDAGYFPDTVDTNGSYVFREYLQLVFELHNLRDGVNQNCVSSFPVDEQWKCFIAQYLFPYISTPTFVYNSLYDSVALPGYGQLCLPPNCNDDGLQYIEFFGMEVLQALQVVINTPESGLFAHSCLVHCHTLYNDIWNDIEVDGVTAPKAFVDWYNDDSIGSSDQKHKYIGCTLNSNEPCNPTCAAFGYGTATPTGKATSIHQSWGVVILLLLLLGTFLY